MRAGGDLPKTGDPCGHLETLIVMRLEMIDLVRDARTRANQRHLAPQDVDQLRQFVEAGLPKRAADPCDGVSAIELVQAVRAESCAGGHDRADVFAMLTVLGVRPHGAELQGGEFIHLETEPTLAEEDGAA